MANTKKYVNPAEAARLLNCSKPLILNRIKSGELPASQVVRPPTYKIKISDLRRVQFKRYRARRRPEWAQIPAKLQAPIPVLIASEAAVPERFSEYPEALRPALVELQDEALRIEQEIRDGVFETEISFIPR